jgi:cytochrome c556
MSRIVVCVALVVMVAGVAMAQFAKPEDAIQYRKSVMFLIAQHFKRMGAVMQGKADFDREIFVSNAEVVKMLATLPWDAFLTPGTDKGDTTMTSAVFEKKDEFLNTANALQRDTSLLAEAAKGMDLEGIKPVFNEVAQDCKACHSAFRK